ncbi:hypothetical protein TorRG33x02_340910 [Trema orientale]|uniref:Uncharacterized protein n=1 Tax=Trema orientale TaxID=63057 RepID=A0A2P5AUJ0_TREOI|nr:hypothetical protein TorRG33x02_340910 [Trema orientale]
MSENDTIVMQTVCLGPTRHVLSGWILGVFAGPELVWCTASTYASTLTRIPLDGTEITPLPLVVLVAQPPHSTRSFGFGV